MGIGSITLGVLSFLCMLGGILFSIVPFLGPMLAFLAPVLALLGIIFGGVALSRAREGGGENESLAIGGLITNIIAFLPATLVALTCGVCGTCWTGVVLTPHDAGPPHAVFPDAGTAGWATPVPVPGPPPYPPPVIPPVIAPPSAPFGTTPPTVPPGVPTAPPSAPPTTAPPTTPPVTTPPPTTGANGPSTVAPGSSGPALPPPPLPPGPHLRHSEPDPETE